MAVRFILFGSIALLFTLTRPTVANGQDSTVAATTVSVLSGVYTEDQAKKGESTYGKFCVACHEATEHAGEVFEEAWVGRPVFEYFTKIRTTMPDDEPGKLNDKEYTDIVAYMLKLTGYPSGQTALPYEPEKLRGIMIERRPKPPSSTGTAMGIPRWYFPHAGVAPKAHR